MPVVIAETNKWAESSVSRVKLKVMAHWCRLLSISSASLFWFVLNRHVGLCFDNAILYCWSHDGTTLVKNRLMQAHTIQVMYNQLYCFVVSSRLLWGAIITYIQVVRKHQYGKHYSGVFPNARRYGTLFFYAIMSIDVVWHKKRQRVLAID